MATRTHEESRSLELGSGERASTALWVRRHLLAGWLGLLIFLSMGILLEVLHAFKVSDYVDLRNSTRRWLWTLGHAHGTLFSLVSLAWAWTASGLHTDRFQRVASWGLLGGLILLPLGFVLGGWDVKAGDPGIGILFVPVGAASMLIGVGAAVMSVWSHGAAMPTETFGARAGLKSKRS